MALSLPVELIEQILDEVEMDGPTGSDNYWNWRQLNRRSMADCSLVCRAWLLPAQSRAFRHIDLSLESKPQLTRFNRVLDTSPHLAVYVRELELRAMFTGAANIFLEIAPNLVHLRAITISAYIDIETFALSEFLHCLAQCFPLLHSATFKTCKAVSVESLVAFLVQHHTLAELNVSDSKFYPIASTMIENATTSLSHSPSCASGLRKIAIERSEGCSNFVNYLTSHGSTSFGSLSALSLSIAEQETSGILPLVRLYIGSLERLDIRLRGGSDANAFIATLRTERPVSLEALHLRYLHVYSAFSRDNWVFATLELLTKSERLFCVYIYCRGRRGYGEAIVGIPWTDCAWGDLQDVFIHRLQRAHLVLVTPECDDIKSEIFRRDIKERMAELDKQGRMSFEIRKISVFD